MKTVDQNDRLLAVDAFIESHALASSDKERARALWKYAELLNQEGDPQNADRMIREARRLDAGNQEIADLADAIQVQIENPTREQLVRGLAASLYKPLHVVTATDQLAGAGASLAVPDTSMVSGDSASIRIPINFEFNSTTLDPSTSRNIELLANTLSDDEFQGRNFEFVGHADVRGDAQYNMALSRQRATAIYEVVMGIDANLEGRISVSGLGESDPIELGDSEEAHRANRRLQILVK
jgi:outer membrane protein OmpA-like peptidoglycan-associated protein